MRTIYTALLSLLLFGGFFSGCASTKLATPKIEYSGPPLRLHDDYQIFQVSPESTTFTISAPDSEHILLNFYGPDGQLEMTLIDSMGGVHTISLLSAAEKYGYLFKPGEHKLILFGARGRGEFHLNVQ